MGCNLTSHQSLSSQSTSSLQLMAAPGQSPSLTGFTVGSIAFARIQYAVGLIAVDDTLIAVASIAGNLSRVGAEMEASQR